MKTFTDTEPSVHEAWRRENLLHLLAVVEAPKRLARGAVEAIKRAVGPENAIVGGRDVEALARYQRRRSDRAVVRSAKAPGQLPRPNRVIVRPLLSFARFGGARPRVTSALETRAQSGAGQQHRHEHDRLRGNCWRRA